MSSYHSQSVLNWVFILLSQVTFKRAQPDGLCPYLTQLTYRAWLSPILINPPNTDIVFFRLNEVFTQPKQGLVTC